MNHYVGLDVSLKEVSVCVVDAEGTVVNRASLATEPDVIADFLLKEAQMRNVLCMKVEYLPPG